MFNVNKLPDMIDLVHQSEDNVIIFEFDFSEWAEYGEGSFFIKHQRSGDSDPYIVPTVTVNGYVATWTVSDTDTAVNGFGKMECNYVGEDFVKKSDVVTTRTYKALDSNGEVPEPMQDWLTQLIEIKDEAQQAVVDAEAQVDLAEQEVENARGYAQQAQESAQQASHAYIYEYSNGRLTIRRSTNG